MSEQQLVPAVGAHVSQLAWPAVEKRLATGAVGVLPVGAASKQHGYHLPLNTDFLQAEWLAFMLSKTENVVVWPTLSYGHYPAFVNYPGSISLSEATFSVVVEEVLAGISASGATRVAVLNTGISTVDGLERALEGCECDNKQLINVYSGTQFATAAAALEEQAWGGHADEIETSIVLAIAAQQVDMDAATPALERIESGIFNRTEPGAPNFSPSGANGNPTLATADKGRRLVRAMVADARVAIRAQLDGAAFRE